jgi:hypothetical protein
MFLGLRQTEKGLELRPRAGVVLYPGHSWTPTNTSEQDIRLIQHDTQRLLTGLVDARDTWVAHEHTGEQTQYAPPLFSLSLYSQLLAQYPHTEHQRPCFQGQMRHLFHFTLMLLLGQEPPNRILRCPECKKIFYRVRKQRYCSRPCVNRATVRKWRATEEAKKQEKDRAHKRYRKKMAPRRVTPRRAPRESIE